jgi:hypothetical protein
MFSWSGEPGGSRKKGRGGGVCSGGDIGHDADELDDDEDMASEQM